MATAMIMHAVKYDMSPGSVIPPARSGSGPQAVAYTSTRSEVQIRLSDFIKIMKDPVHLSPLAFYLSHSSAKMVRRKNGSLAVRFSSVDRRDSVRKLIA